MVIDVGVNPDWSGAPTAKNNNTLAAKKLHCSAYIL